MSKEEKKKLFRKFEMIRKRHLFILKHIEFIYYALLG